MSHATSFAILALVVLFSLYRRVRRTVGLQRIVPRSMWTRIAVFAVICALFLFAGLTRPLALVADVAGAATGAVIALVALRSTVFEQRDDAVYYRTHTWIGLGISAVFVVRLVYRFTSLQGAFSTSAASSPGAAPHLQFASYAADPLTTGVYFLLAAYYAVYYTLLMRKASAEA